MPSRCNRRSHLLSESDRAICANGKESFVELVCPACGKPLYGCKRCASNPSLKKWAFRDKGHIEKDHDVKRGSGRCGRRKVIRQSKRRKTTSKLSIPRLLTPHPDGINIKTITGINKSVQLVYGFIPELYAGGGNGRHIDKMPCSYHGKDGAKKITVKRLEKKDPTVMRYINSGLKKNGLKLVGTTPIHIYKNQSKTDTAYTEVHSDKEIVMIVMTSGTKVVWFAGEETDKNNFVDMAGREWKAVNNNDAIFSRHWELAESHPNSVDLGSMFYKAGFRRCTLGPGDAIILPPRFLHAVSTETTSTGLSLTIGSK